MASALSSSAAAAAAEPFDAAVAVAVGRIAGSSSGSTPRAGVGTRGPDLTGLGWVPLSVSAISTPRKIGDPGADTTANAGSASPSASSTPRRQPGSRSDSAVRKGVSMIHRDEPIARRQAGGEVTTAVDEVPASASTPLGGWQYICSVYGHSVVGFGAATAIARPSSSLQTDWTSVCSLWLCLPAAAAQSTGWRATWRCWYVQTRDSCSMHCSADERGLGEDSRLVPIVSSGVGIESMPAQHMASYIGSRVEAQVATAQ